MHNQDINEVRLKGALYKEPTVRFTSAGSGVADFMLITKRQYRDKEYKTYHKIKTGKDNVELVRNLGEGEQLTVQGSIQNRSFEKEGKKQWVTEIYANKIELVNKPHPIKIAETYTSDDDFHDDDIPF